MPEIDFGRLASQLLSTWSTWLPKWFPDGTLKGHEWVALNPTRADGKPGSLKINTATGRWSDFATGDAGGDLISAYAYRYRLPQGAAARQLAKLVGELPPAPAVSALSRNVRTVWRPIIPIPADAPAVETQWTHYVRGTPKGSWTYLDAAGRPLFHVVRFETSAGGKEILPITFCEGPGGKREYRYLGVPTPRPLYGLWRLAEKPDADVLIVEGEKCADAAAALLPEFAVITWPGGGRAVDKADWTPLAGRTVVIWADCDAARDRAGEILPESKQPGMMAAERIVQIVAPTAAQVSIVQTPAPGDVSSGWDVADAIAEGWDAGRLREFIGRTRPPTAADTPPTMEKRGEAATKKAPVPKRFKLHARGLWRIPLDREGSPKAPVWVCSRIEPLALVRNWEGRSWGVLVTLIDRDGRPHRLVLAAEQLVGEGTDAVRTLVDHGLVLAARGAEHLIEYLGSIAPSDRVRITDRMGHHGEIGAGVFVLPERVIRTEGSEEWLFNGSADLAARAFATRGTLDGWKKLAALAQGNSRLVLALSMAFAAALVGPLGAENGGVNLIGGSSTGKSTALALAGSVCGGAAYRQTWRVSDNGVESTAVAYCDCLLILDELGQVDGKIAGEAALMLSQGVGKLRANRTGNARPRATWRLLFLSAGEVGLAAHMAEANRRVRAGQDLRLAELPGDAGAGLGVFEELHGFVSGSAFAVHLNAVARQEFGTAFPAFLEALLPQLDDVAQKWKRFRTGFESKVLGPTAGGQARRVASRLALIAFGGELASNFGVLPWPAGEATRGVARCFAAWVQHRGGDTDAEEREALRTVRAFLEQHGESRFTPWDRPSIEDNRAPRTLLRCGYRRNVGPLEEPEVRYYIFAESWRTEVCRGLDSAAVAEVLAAKGFLKKDGAGKCSRPERLPSEGVRRVYVVDGSILAGDEDEGAADEH